MILPTATLAPVAEHRLDERQRRDRRGVGPQDARPQRDRHHPGPGEQGGALRLGHARVDGWRMQHDRGVGLTRRADDHVAELHADNQKLRAGELAAAVGDLSGVGVLVLGAAYRGSVKEKSIC